MTQRPAIRLSLLLFTAICILLLAAALASPPSIALAAPTQAAIDPSAPHSADQRAAEPQTIKAAGVEEPRYTARELLSAKEAGEQLIVTSWIAAVYFVTGFIAGVVVLFDAWGWIADKQTARKWAYLCVVTSVFGVAAYLVWKKRSRQEDKHRLFCMSCGSYFEGGAGLCPHCGAPTSGGGRSRTATPL